ncbi:MAG: ABC transporter family substrate-binding protein [Sciscionella sp.]
MVRAGRRTALLLAPLTAGALILSGCGGGSGSGSGGSAQAHNAGSQQINARPVSKLKDGGTLTVAITGWPEQFNFEQVNGLSDDNSRIDQALLQTPFLGTADGGVTMNKNLLESAKLVSKKPQTVDFKINKKAMWSDGTPITWKDFEAGWKANNGKNPAYQPGGTQGWDAIKSVTRGTDDKDVKIVFSKPYAEWKGLMNFLYPASQIDTPEKFNKGWINKIPVTAGPFKVKKIDPTAQTLTLERDPNWWGPKPKLDTVIFRVVDQASQPQAFQSGAIDAIDIGTDVATYQTMKGLQNADVRKALSRDWRVLDFSGKPGTPLADPNVRLAVMQGIDRKDVGKATLGPMVPDIKPLNNHFFVQGEKGYQDHGTLYSYDPAAAKKALDAAGWKLQAGKKVREKDGKKLNLTFMIPANTPVSATEMQKIQNQLAKIGVQITPNAVDPNAWGPKFLTTGNFDLANQSWIGTPWPISSSPSIYDFDPKNTQQNFGRIPDTEGIGKLLAKANGTLDDAERTHIANQADKAVSKEGFSLPLYQRPDCWAVKKGLANYGAFGFADPDWTKVGWTK